MTAQRVGVACPLCGDVVSLALSVYPRLGFFPGSGRKGFLTADVGLAGVEHTCPKVLPPREEPK